MFPTCSVLPLTALGHRDIANWAFPANRFDEFFILMLHLSPPRKNPYHILAAIIPMPSPARVNALVTTANPRASATTRTTIIAISPDS